EREKIAIIAISEVINGDNDTTIFTIVDFDLKVYHLDMLGLKSENYMPTYNFFHNNYGLDKLEANNDFKTTIFYPEELRGKYPYDNSILTRLTRFFINAGGGRLSEKVKCYIVDNSPAGT
ncbi:MAG: hypothetical protein AAGG68_05525, partial [Bacteroidota bacterium]